MNSMKKNLKLKLFIACLFSLIGSQTRAQAEKPALSLDFVYHNDNSHLQYLTVGAKAKVNGKFQMIEGIPLKFYITEDTSAKNFLGQAVTDLRGTALLYINPTAQPSWNASAQQSFTVVSGKTTTYDPVISSISIRKARIMLDTTEGRSVKATLVALNDSAWEPVKGVDLTVAIKRLDGDLNVDGANPTYTTDSTGAVAAEFKQDSLPGDAKGNIILIAKADATEAFGTVTAEKTVPWGYKAVYTSNFNERSLFARRGYSPLWLEMMAYSIVVVVWGILIYLILQIRKMRTTT